MILKEGDRVTADARIVNSQALRVDESILTGEAYSVGKKAEAIKKEGLVLGDQKNMVFSGTSVVSGNCEAVVVQTGMNSEIGKISKDILETSQIPLPLAKKVLKLTHFISIAVLLIALATLAIGLLRGIGFVEILGAVIGLSVSIVPEGLPVAVTIPVWVKVVAVAFMVPSPKARVVEPVPEASKVQVKSLLAPKVVVPISVVSKLRVTVLLAETSVSMPLVPPATSKVLPEAMVSVSTSSPSRVKEPVVSVSVPQEKTPVSLHRSLLVDAVSQSESEAP